MLNKSKLKKINYNIAFFLFIFCAIIISIFCINIIERQQANKEILKIDNLIASIGFDYQNANKILGLYTKENEKNLSVNNYNMPPVIWDTPELNIVGSIILNNKKTKDRFNYEFITEKGWQIVYTKIKPYTNKFDLNNSYISIGYINKNIGYFDSNWLQHATKRKVKKFLCTKNIAYYKTKEVIDISYLYYVQFSKDIKYKHAGLVLFGDNYMINMKMEYIPFKSMKVSDEFEKLINMLNKYNK